MVLATVYAFVHLVVRVRTFPSILSNLSGFIDRVEHIIIVSRHLASFFVAGSGAVSADSWIGVYKANAVLPLPPRLSHQILQRLRAYVFVLSEHSRKRVAPIIQKNITPKG